MEQKKLKVYHVQGWKEYSSWINHVQPVNSVKEADLVIFPGGADVSPKIYGHPKHKYTHDNIERDEVETAIYEDAVRQGKYILGICRGSQFICAKQPKGMLVQHQPNPLGVHGIKTYDGRKVDITSTHHQAMYPFNMEEGSYKILGWTEKMLEFHQDGDEKELNPPKECEIVYFPKVKALGIQGHPESMSSNHDTNIYLRDLLDKFLENKL